MRCFDLNFVVDPVHYHFGVPKDLQTSDIFFIASSIVTCMVSSSALLLEHFPGAYFTCTLCFFERYKTPPEPPNGGSP